MNDDFSAKQLRALSRMMVPAAHPAFRFALPVFRAPPHSRPALPLPCLALPHPSSDA